MMSKLSIIIPVYNEVENIPDLYQRLIKTFKNDFIEFDYEMIFVDDGSNDQSFELLKAYHQKDQKIKILRFSRNFGHHLAIKAGLDHAKGEFTVIMDADLQDRPEDLIKLYHRLKEGYDIVFGHRSRRQDPFLKRFFSSCFFKVMNRLSNIHMLENQAMLRIFNKKVLQALQQINEIHQNNGAFLAWMGFKQSAVEIQHQKRAKGKTKYHIFNSLKFAIETIINFSNKPLLYISMLGILISFIAVVFSAYIIYQKIFHNIGLVGWPSLFAATLFLGGMILFALGILGLYLGRLYQESLKRPLYIISAKID